MGGIYGKRKDGERNSAGKEIIRVITLGDNDHDGGDGDNDDGDDDGDD